MESIGLWTVLIGAGFVAGYFLATPVLVALTVVYVGFNIWSMGTAREIEKLIAMLYLAASTIAFVAMWVTHYYVTNQGWLQEFAQKYILR